MTLPTSIHDHLIDLIRAKDSDGRINTAKQVPTNIRKMIAEYEASEATRIKSFLEDYTKLQG